MTASGRVEELEALYNHIDYLNSRLDMFDSMTGASSYVYKEFHSTQGEKIKKAIDQYLTTKDAPTKKGATLNLSGHQQFINKLATYKFYIYAQALKYMYQFCFLTKHELKNLCERVKDFDLRWNQYITIRCCQLYVQYCKTILFIKAHPISKYIILVSSYFPKEFQIYEKVCDSTMMSKTSSFIISCSQDPLSFIHTDVEFLSSPLARLAGTVGAFIARLFGTFPLIDFNQFSIFDSPASQTQSTLMNDEFIILSHLSLMKETLFFFLFAFFEKTNTNQCFELVVESLLTESPKISLSKIFMVPINDFLSYSQNGYIPDRLLMMAEEMSINKFTTSHKQRMMHVTFLIQDILGIVKFRLGMLPHLINNIVAVCGMAFYELDQYFMFNNLRCAEAIELLSVTLELADLIRKNQEDIKRFFIYNLSTVDNQFLKQQLSPDAFKNLTDKQYEYEIVMLLNSLSDSLDAINIVDYDNGVRYDFTAFEITYGRYLRVFNDLKCRVRLTFLEPIFEHLTTIRFHMELARNPLETFLYYCPLHSLWRHTIPIVSGNVFDGTINDNTWTRHINDPNIPIIHSASLLQIFTFFSHDFKCLRQMPDVVSNMKIVFSIIRQKLFEKVQKIISQNLDPSSQVVRVGLQSRDYSKVKKFYTGEFTAFTAHKFSKGMKEAQYKAVTLTNQVKMFSQSIPKSIMLFEDSPDQTALYFAKTLMQSLSGSLFPMKIPDPSLMDRSFTAASEYLWPIWAILRAPFPFQMFLCRHLNSFPLETSNKIQEQLKYFTGEVPYVAKPKEKQENNSNQQQNDPNPMNFLSLKKTELITGIEHKYDAFIDHKYENMIYLSSLKGFWKKGSAVLSRQVSSPSQPSSPSKQQIQEQQQQEANQAQQSAQRQSVDFNGSYANLALQIKTIEESKSSFYTKDSFVYIVKNLGLHAALRIDRIFIHKIASLLNDIYNAFLTSFSRFELNNWFTDFTLHGKMPSDESIKKILSSVDFNGLCKKVVLLGSCVTMRANLLDVIKMVVNDTIPGFQEILLSSLPDSLEMSPIQALVAEAILGSDSPGSNVFFHKFFEGPFKIVAYPNISHFFFFLALLLTNKIWDNCIYLPEFDSITENLHLFPVAVKTFIQLHTIFFTKEDVTIREIKNGSNIFISALAQIAENRSSKKQRKASTAFTILADMYPRIVGIEYERIEKVFPNRKINFAYSPEL